MNIIVLCGGLSAERDVSLISASLVTRALRELGHKAIPVDVYFGYTGSYDDPREIFDTVPDGTALAISEDAPDLEAVKASRRQANDSLLGDNVIEVCRAADLVFMALHGADGENGKLQGLFDVMGIRYTGCGHLASAVSMDKEIAKKVIADAGVPVPRGQVVTRAEADHPAPFLPCVVKPRSGGSSIGTSIVREEAEYLPALELGFSYEPELLVEEYISGRECDVAVLMGKALPAIEICPKSGFYNYQNKYQPGLTDEYCPARQPEHITKKLLDYAERVFRAIGMEVYARMDFKVREDEEVVCLEANTLPGLTPTSLLPQEAAAVGISFNELIAQIVAGSLAKYER